MKLLRTLLTTTLITATAITPAFAQSKLQRYRENFDRTAYLLKRAGVKLRLNESSCKFKGRRSSKTIGTYNSGTTTICQVDWKIVGEEQWYSTFYHEAFHFIQDALDGAVGDGKMTPMFYSCSKVKTKAECQTAYNHLCRSADYATQKHSDTYGAKQPTHKGEWLEREAVLWSDQPQFFPTFLSSIIKNLNL